MSEYLTGEVSTKIDRIAEGLINGIAETIS